MRFLACVITVLSILSGCSNPGPAVISVSDDPVASDTSDVVITAESLLDEMADLQRLAEFPVPAYTTRQFSSYNRQAQSPDNPKGWFSNKDIGRYLREEENQGRKEFVMMDAAGPGAVVRIWSANPKGILRIYIDKQVKPVMTVPMNELLEGELPEFPKPLAGMRARGCNLYCPIPYAYHCKITIDQPLIFYQINYRTYAEGTKVSSLQSHTYKDLADQVRKVARRLAQPRKGRRQPSDCEIVPFDMKIHPSAGGTPVFIEGDKAICGLSFHLEAADIDQALRQTLLTISFDEEHTVVTPLIDFFGTSTFLERREV